jgi:hypothetical protein
MGYPGEMAAGVGLALFIEDSVLADKKSHMGG